MEKKWVVCKLNCKSYNTLEEATSQAKKLANSNGYEGQAEYGAYQLVGYTKTPDPAIEFIAVV